MIKDLMLDAQKNMVFSLVSSFPSVIARPFHFQSAEVNSVF